MKLSHVLSRTTSQEDLRPRSHTPWIASPLEEGNTHASLEHSSVEELKLKNGERVVEFQDPNRGPSSVDVPVFKHHHESSTVELFYDLFLLQILQHSLRTTKSEIQIVALKNYIGFFTILWFTWLETSFFDVRFSSDSVFNRICKAVSFGVMTGFAISGAIYDTSSPKAIHDNVKAFRAMALILMISRLALVAQYGVVLWYVRKYKKTFLPLASTMAVSFLASMVFLGTFWGFPSGKRETSFPNEVGGANTYIAWYVVVCVEAFAIIVISCVWRVVSFKRTHLVERMGLLTLIIMGEGIIGMTKSVSNILQNASQIHGSDIGVIVAAVLIIYFIWVLYFDQIENDRFGTIRQQIWAFLHFPLHVAILLTVEGSSMLILWNVISGADILLWTWYPTSFNDYDYKYWGQYGGFNTTDTLVEYLRYALETAGSTFKEESFAHAYDANLTQIADVKYKFGTQNFDNTVGPMVDSIWYDMENKIYQAFGVDLPETSAPSSGADHSAALFNVFNQVWLYIFLAAGGFLMILAILYWFGKTHKSRGEWISVAVRAIAGIGLALGCLENWVLLDTASSNFVFSPWPLLTIMLTFFVVIVLDNLLVWHTNKTIAHQTSVNRNESYSLTDSLSKRGESRGQASSLAAHSQPQEV